ncbi:sedoheptulose 7-phosphate cyclase [Arthrobacter sp. ISL-48]|uniref:sedoheptulose 7-phosphate cyclase n=1 Tax=Arthrobacter sp. ISL-48 TaxID=2819110 RepID=UPI001BECDCC6|nr:sedoheptulose 7-phosphate cyclase [Arthrobacter sp. ISL-48]MBT2533963.1 sedoheptulose 7-phosphate cyclase [Arthrobacter sp. ISL-48]
METFPAESKFDPRNTSGAWTVEHSHTITYEVRICKGLLDLENPVLAESCLSRQDREHQVLIVLDDAVNEIYRQEIHSYFVHWGLVPSYMVLEGNEGTKDVESAMKVAARIGEVGLLRRSEKVVVIGGGVVMDVVGMAASLFRRGVPYVRVPTTLLGQVDAGVGVKTGVNYGDHKNRLGTYYAPACSLIDPTFLSSVPHRHIVNGLAEVVKMALVKDAALFNLLENSLLQLSGGGFGSHSPIHGEIIRRSVSGMLEELEPNLHESNLERIVDFGHTFSPSLELIADPPVLHGEAVAIDMAVCVALSHDRRLLTEQEAVRVYRLLTGIGLPVSDGLFTPELLVKALNDTVKHRDGKQRLPLLIGIGKADFFNDVSSFELHKAVRSVNRLEKLAVGPVLPEQRQAAEA